MDIVEGKSGKRAVNWAATSPSEKQLGVRPLAKRSQLTISDK